MTAVAPKLSFYALFMVGFHAMITTAHLDLRNTIESMHEALHSHDALTISTVEELDTMNSFIQESTVSDSIGDIEKMIQDINRKQLETVLDKLTEFIDGEMEARAKVKEATKRKSSVVETGVRTYQELKEDVDTELASWVEDVFVAETQAATKAIASKLPTTSTGVGEVCLDIHTAAREVQAVLTALGDKTHSSNAQKGSIVYEMTSPTYTTPPEPKDTLAYWRNYIPEDIESLLPRGWGDFSLRSSLQSLPPSTALDPELQPGMCWPMSGDKGSITIRLEDAIHLEAVSVHHVSSSLLHGNRQSDSAPREIEIHTYTPCVSQSCSLGFEEASDTHLATVEYDRAAGIGQTFSLRETQDDADNSCSLKESCSNSADGVAAVRLQVNSNWRESEFTCLYYIEVFGERVSKQ